MNVIAKVLGLAIVATAVESWAQQSPPAIQEFDQNRRFQEQQQLLPLKPGEMAPELYPGENEDVGPQRILQVKPRRKYVEAGADSQYFYTSNVLLTKDGTDSALFVNTVHLALAPDAYEVKGGYLSPRVGFRNQWYNYGLDGHRNNWDAFDFDGQTLFGEVPYRFLDNWIGLVSMDATRLLDQHSYSEFYKELAPGWGIQRLFPINDHQMISLSYRGYYHLSTVAGPMPSNANDRYDHMFGVSYGLEILPRLFLQPYYRFQLTQYTEHLGPLSGRDIIHSVGATLSYWFNSWSGVRTFINYEHKKSNDPVTSSYEKFDAGGGVSLLVRF